VEIDWKAAQERFRAMSREELLDEAALHIDGYTPMARSLLEGEVTRRGISAAEIEERRAEAAAPEPLGSSNFPALLVSSMDREEVKRLAEALRRDGVPAVARETGMSSGGCHGHDIGRWGLFVPGLDAARAGRLLDAHLPASPRASCGGASCGDVATGREGCASGSPGAPGDPDYPAGDDAWPEDGDWWKSGPAS
jgi:hypothetical protein